MATSTARSRSSASRARPRPPSGKAAAPTRASSPPTSTPTTRSGRWSKSSARPTSSPATRTSRHSPTRSRCTSPRPRPATSPPRRSPRPSARPRSGSSRRRPGRKASPTRWSRRSSSGQLAKWAKEVALLDQTHVNADKHDVEDDRGAAPGDRGEDRRERPNRALRLLPRRRGIGSPRPRGRQQMSPEPRFRRILLKLSGEALMGDLAYGTDGDEVRRIAKQVAATRGARRRGGDRGRRRQHLPRPRGGGRGHGPGHRRLHGDAGDGAQRADAPGRAREARRAHAGDVGDRRQGGRRALHPPPRDAPPREGPGRDLRRRHRQPVLHHRHRGGAARPRDPRRGDPDGQERGRGRLRLRPARSTRTRPSSPRSATARRSSGACR